MTTGTLNPTEHLSLGPSGSVDTAHRLLLWADCLLPDDLVVAARAWLADGLADDVAAAVAFAVLSDGLTVPDRFAGVLAGAMLRAGAAPDAVRVDGTGTLPDVTFAPADTDGPATALDLSDHADTATDPTDRAVIALARMLPDATALWRSWRRRPAVRGPGGATRGYLVRLADPPPGVDPRLAAVRLADVAAWLQRNLAAPMRVYRHEHELPIHLRMALDNAALVWTPAPTVPLRISVDGPGAVAPGPTRLAYLRAGTAVLVDLAHDPADHPAYDTAGPPMVRTDGTWLWGDTATGIDPDLAAHIDRVAAPPPFVDETILRRAVIALTGP